MAVSKFDPESEGWEAFIRWRRLPQLSEVVSIEIECILSLADLTPDDRREIASSDLVGPHPRCFKNLERLKDAIRRRAPVAPFNLLCVHRQPVTVPSPRTSFEPLGYDLIEDRTGISAVTNCGHQFSDVIEDAEINRFGLIDAFERAKVIQAELLIRHRGDLHANCSLWAISRML